MNWLQWQHGRNENKGLRKLLLAQSQRFKFDCYILELPAGQEVPMHTDPAVEGFEHHRVNITLTRALGGIQWLCLRDGAEVKLSHRLYRFRPDLQPHRVSRVVSGTLRLLSIGWLKKK